MELVYFDVICCILLYSVYNNAVRFHSVLFCSKKPNSVLKNRIEPTGTDWNRLEPTETDWNRLEPTGLEYNQISVFRAESRCQFGKQNRISTKIRFLMLSISQNISKISENQNYPSNHQKFANLSLFSSVLFCWHLISRQPTGLWWHFWHKLDFS